MKNKNIISSIVGAGFFAVGYLGLAVPIIPALALGLASFGASELIINGTKTEEKQQLTFEENISQARKYNSYIQKMTKEIDDDEVKKDLNEILASSEKIVDFIHKNQLKNKTGMKFLEYYLPVCVKIIEDYDEIENQQLTSRDSKKFMEDGKNIIKNTNKSFKKILNSLYQSDIIKADAEMKVYNAILKADGYDESILESGDEDE